MSDMRWILLTGLMGSGKSTLIREYILNFKTVEFTNPPVEAKFHGQDFEFLDNIFGVRNRLDKHIYNFYELDSPTVKRWTQFISTAHGIIIIANIKQKVQYSTPDSLLDVIMKYAPETPILFVATNYDDFEEAKEIIRQNYKIEKISHDNYDFLGTGHGESKFDEIYGQRILLKPEFLKKIFEWHFQARK